MGYGALGNRSWLLLITFDSVRPWIWSQQVANIPMALWPTRLKIWIACQWLALIARLWFSRARLRIQDSKSNFWPIVNE